MSNNLHTYLIVVTLTSTLTRWWFTVCFVFQLKYQSFDPTTPINPPSSSCTPRPRPPRPPRDEFQPAYIPTHTHHLNLTQPAYRRRSRTTRNLVNTLYLTILNHSVQMPGLHWPFVLAPLPPRKKKRVQPGFTDEELLYLEEVLALVRPLFPLSLYLHSC